MPYERNEDSMTDFSESSYEVIIGKDQEQLDEHGKKGTIFLGKHIVGEGENAHLTNKVRLDVSSPHRILISGKTGTGKSYSAGVIAEELAKLPDPVKENVSAVMIDTMGIFWSMKDQNEKDIDLLSEWDLKPQGFDDVNLVIPKGLQEKYDEQNISYDSVVTISPRGLNSDDWIAAFNLDGTDDMSLLLQRVIPETEIETIDDIIEGIKKDETATEKVKNSLIGKFQSAKNWGIFAREESFDVLNPGGITVFDVSHYGGDSPIAALLVGILSRKIYEARISARREEEKSLQKTGTKDRTTPLTWIMIDEAHMFLPSEGTTAASDPLITLVKQGRQPGIGLVFITQQPYKLHPDALSQTDILLTHRLTAKSDIDALRSIMQTYVLFDITEYINTLPKWKGSAIVMDDNSERIYKLRVRPRQSWHAGGTPTALNE